MYGKTACHSRTELVARLFFDHYLPRIAAGMPPGADGWSLARSPAPSTTAAGPPDPRNPSLPGRTVNDRPSTAVVTP
jgi:hypothetical protein